MQSKVQAQSVDTFNENGISLYSDFNFDTNIVQSYEHLFGLEISLHNKDLKWGYRALKSKPNFNYQPNTDLTLGLGFTYRYLSLRATVKILPTRKAVDLQSNSFDFQSQVVGKSYLSFITTQLYKGFYAPYDAYKQDFGTNYIRPDVGFTLLGLNNMYAFNKQYVCF